ncbi:MAG: dihydrolipoyl dehydrogenase [Planctomycetes bacterium]|nr:dihydrolipoyl dehydrogenase [Planctomycetota bacterium]
MVVGEFTQEAELVVLGGGPGGYTAAFRAAELGIETVIVDPHGGLGGVCLHHGCIPSKTLLSIGEAIGLAERAQRFGVQFSKPTVDLAKVRQWTQQTIETLAAGLEGLRKKHGVELIKGAARFEDTRNIVVHDGQVSRLRFKRAVIATGSSPLSPPGEWPRSPRVMDSAAALALEAVPRTLLVIGSDYIAVELASLYAALGSEVTLAAPDGQLLPQADADLVRPLARRLDTILAEVCLGTTITDLREAANGLEVRFGGVRAAKRNTFERVLVAVGLRPNTDHLDLAKAQVQLDTHGFVQVDDQQRSSNPRIFAVGDVTGEPMLADKAVHQARVAAEVIAGWKSAYDPRAVPCVVFTDPQVAWCGLSEAQAKAAGISYQVSTAPWATSGRAVSMGRTDGRTKLIVDPDTKLLLGMGMVGAGAAELIAQGVLALEMGAEVGDLASSIQPHPTLSELIGEAARQTDSASKP